MPREFQRSDRVASQIQRELAELLRTFAKDSRLGMVTVSEVEVSRDLAVAKAFVTFLGGSGTPQESLSLLNEAVPNLRRELSRKLTIRVMPELRFVFDDSIDRGMRMDSLLRGLNDGASGDAE